VDGLEAVLADVLTAEPEESLPHAHREPSRGALHLLRRRDFRLTYAAIATSELGYAFQYIALMWFALEVAGPAGVLIVRLADSVPALLFGLHGGLLADRLERRRTMIAADLFRGAVLIPVAIAGLAGIQFEVIKRDERKAFFASCAYLTGMLASVVFGLYPMVLPARNPIYSLTVAGAKASDYGLKVGLIWWFLGIILATGYFIYVYRNFAGKVSVGKDGHGHA